MVVTAQWVDVKWVRIAGSTRYDTMAAISQESFPGTSEWAVVASGEDFPDALVAGAIAGQENCPIILTTPDQLSEQAKSEIERLKVSKIVLMGGTEAVSDDVEKQLGELNGGIPIDRVWGETRCETAVEAMRHVAGKSDTVIVTTGEKYADALSVGPYSAATCSPILLTRGDGKLDESTIDAIKELGYRKFVIVGGDSVVDPSVRDTLAKAGLSERAVLAGADRYETSRIVAQFMLENGFTAEKPAVATGMNFPDSLAVSSMQAARGSFVVLADDESSDGVSLLVANGSSIAAGYVVGGQEAVSQELMDYLIDHT